ncbi:hypothetical protein IM697_25640 [Streptomyces ferrugineus]|uniref:Glyoxalase-like domain-containing protein n=1 Tax=Streptomyces ferrugineus TaxID=1413221 RepID=A0A7M2SDU6_9ACTN|nr:hypothetical protein IM697_25640 [Streptomyces ferrugineus]
MSSHHGHVLDPSLHYPAGLAWEGEQVMVDSADPEALGRWWAEVLGWVVVCDEPDEFERLHLDYRPHDRDAEVARLLALGARRG